MQQKGITPDYILSSPSESATVTAEKLTKTIGLTTQQVKYDSRLYAASLSHLTNALASCPAETKRVLLIGHNPELESLLTFLDQKESSLADDDKLLPATTLTALNMPNDWSTLNQGCADLMFTTQPPELAL